MSNVGANLRETVKHVTMQSACRGSLVSYKH